MHLYKYIYNRVDHTKVKLDQDDTITIEIKACYISGIRRIIKRFFGFDTTRRQFFPADNYRVRVYKNSYANYRRKRDNASITIYA